MSLEQHVLDRYSTPYLKNLTNPQGINPSAYDATKLTKAAEDVQGMFTTYVGADYVDTNKAHIDCAVGCVILKLMQRTGQFANAELEKQLKDNLKELALTNGRNRPMPISSGSLADSSEPVNQPADFDRGRFAALQPDVPGTPDDPPRD